MPRMPLLVPLFASVLLLAACSTTPVVTDVPAALQAAKSPADHLKLAEYFDTKAAAYEAEAAEHGRLAVAYQGGLGVGGRADKGASMASHCRFAQTQFRNAAGEARSMAQAHRDLASSAR